MMLCWVAGFLVVSLCSDSSRLLLHDPHINMIIIITIISIIIITTIIIIIIIIINTIINNNTTLFTIFSFVPT